MRQPEAWLSSPRPKHTWKELTRSCSIQEHRRCFSFFKPTKPYQLMDVWDMASRAVYILTQSVNYSSDDEKQLGESDLTSRILRANTLLNMLEEWQSGISVHFKSLPVEGPANRAFRPLWIHPPAFGTSVQMHSMARILYVHSEISWAPHKLQPAIVVKLWQQTPSGSGIRTIPTHPLWWFRLASPSCWLRVSDMCLVSLELLRSLHRRLPQPLAPFGVAC